MCSPFDFLKPSSFQPEISRLQMSASLMHVTWVGELTGVVPRALLALSSHLSRAKHRGRPGVWPSGRSMVLLNLSWKGVMGIVLTWAWFGHTCSFRSPPLE
ncbi:hypothetical protein CGRA01v4_04543 [Colletotrichum graminicola]|nr:hypothetical protein CGRA01v4_04543 [Colletotrichum graminicola]